MIFIDKIRSLILKNPGNNETSFSKQFYCLGTIISLTAYGSLAETAINKSEERLNDIDNKMSVFKPDSEISKINFFASKQFQKVSSDTYFVIKKAAYYSGLSHGTFDPTIRPLVKLWSIGKENFRIPTNHEIKESLKLVNYKDIIFEENSSSIMLKNEKQSLDVGGIAKGYAADEINKIFRNYKIKSGIIDLGGNIYTVGKKPNGENWNIGIQNPIKPRGSYVGILSLSNKSIVTSGGYERYSTENNKIYHHILNPKTGYPAENEIISTTIISDKSIDGDGLSTGLYIMGLKKSINLIESLDGIDAVFITKNNKIYLTSNIKNNFNLTNADFSLQEDYYYEK